MQLRYQPTNSLLCEYGKMSILLLLIAPLHKSLFVSVQFFSSLVINFFGVGGNKLKTHTHLCLH